MHNENSKRSYRLPPCPVYDVAGTETWLSDLARDGLLLEKDGFFAGFFSFQHGSSQNVRYRLEPDIRNPGFLDSIPENPDEDALELYARYGWEYVLKYKDFHIFRTSQPDARELNTDPQVQAMTLNILRKRSRRAAITEILYLILLLVFGFERQLLLTMIGVGTPLILLIFLLVVWAAADQFLHFWRLHKLYRQLKEEQKLEHQKNWKSRAKLHKSQKIIYLCILLLVIVLSLKLCALSVSEEDHIPLSAYSGTPPFITIAQIDPEGTYKLSDWGYGNTVRIWSDWIAPVNYEWDETAELTTKDGKISGSIAITYHETLSPWLAQKIAEQYVRNDDQSKYYHELDLPELDVSYAEAYNNYGFTVVLQDENKVIRMVSFLQNPDDSNAYALWAEKMAQYWQKNERLP